MRNVICAAALAVALGGGVEAATLIESFGGSVAGATAFSSNPDITQSFTTPADGTADWMQSFEILVDDGSSYPGAFSTFRAYLFQGVFAGSDVNDIPTLTPGGPEGLLGVGMPTQLAGGGDPDAYLARFDFPAMAALLQPGTLYSVTIDPVDSTMVLGGIRLENEGDSYPGGTFYLVDGGTNLVSLEADLSFRVTATQVPEPSTFGMVFVALLATLARRRR